MASAKNSSRILSYIAGNWQCMGEFSACIRTWTSPHACWRHVWLSPGVFLVLRTTRLLCWLLCLPASYYRSCTVSLYRTKQQPPAHRAGVELLVVLLSKQAKLLSLCSGMSPRLATCCAAASGLEVMPCLQKTPVRYSLPRYACYLAPAPQRPRTNRV